MTTYSLVLLVTMAAAGSSQEIDTFQYADDETAGEAWVASTGTPEVEMVRDGDRRVLQFTAPFASQPDLERTIIDRQVQLNLAAPGQFQLEIAVDEPQTAGRLSLYFRSGDGWYAGGAAFSKEGWQTLRFSKASFHIEGQPAGWHQIDGIRISIWRGPPADHTVRLRQLAAISHDIALVIPAAQSHAGDREVQGALHAAENLGGMLDEMGLGSDAVEDAALVRGALGDRHVAILAYNPRLPDEAAAVLEKFVEQGGKLFVCYSLPSRLARVLGIGGTRYVRPAQSDHLAEIRFDAANIPGLPPSVRQASWNITIPEPGREDVRVIGRWFDREGQPTGHAAMVLGESGAYFSHLVLTDDRERKRQMLAAVLGRLHPPLWERMASREYDRIGVIGHLGDADDISRYVLAHGNAKALEQLKAAGETTAQARSVLQGRDFPTSIELSRRARQLLSDAYLRSPPSPNNEGRAIWNHSGTGAYPGDWQRTAQELADAGFNIVLPNMLWAGRAHYASDVLPRSQTYKQLGDQIAQCLAACKQHGVEVHVWKVNHNLSGAPQEFVDKLRAQGRLQASNTGQEQRWLCPSHPDNLQLELESMLEVARKYDVDGLHFDYIRYPNRNHCYCDGCRRQFEAQAEIRVTRWPQDCYSGGLRTKYHDFRRAQITRLVAAVSCEARQLKPGIQISAAVFGAYPDCRESVGQDWVEWVRAGYLDFVCPMDYTQSDPYFIGLVENQLRLVDGRIPVYPGIGAWRLTPDRVVGQIHHARELGAPGYTVFDLSAAAADSVLPAIALGAGANRAAPPRRAQ